MTLGDWLSIAGLVLGIVGFGLTIKQLRRTATASEASNDLLRVVGERLTTNHLLVVLPQLHFLADELDTAVIADDRQGAVRALVGYSRTASQVAALLDASTDSEIVTFVANLRASSTTASAAKSVLVNGTTKTLSQTVRASMTQIADIATAASGVVTKYQSKVS